MDGTSVFERFARAGGGGSVGGRILPGDCRAVPGERVERGEVVTTAAGDGDGGGATDGWPAAAVIGGASGVADEAVGGNAGRNVAGTGGRAGRARGGDELWLGVADPA